MLEGAILFIRLIVKYIIPVEYMLTRTHYAFRMCGKNK